MEFAPFQHLDACQLHNGYLMPQTSRTFGGFLITLLTFIANLAPQALFHA
jgi:hypothetical protein